MGTSRTTTPALAISRSWRAAFQVCRASRSACRRRPGRDRLGHRGERRPQGRPPLRSLACVALSIGTPVCRRGCAERPICSHRHYSVIITRAAFPFRVPQLTVRPNHNAGEAPPVACRSPTAVGAQRPRLPGSAFACSTKSTTRPRIGGHELEAAFEWPLARANHSPDLRAKTAQSLRNGAPARQDVEYSRK
jgi:hypothetical protein